MLASAAENRSVIDLAIQGLKEEHAACVQRIGQMAANPQCQSEVQGYLLRIENINQALVRLAGARLAN